MINPNVIEKNHESAEAHRMWYGDVCYNQAIEDALEIIDTDVERRPRFWSRNKERINFIIDTIKLLKK